MGRRTGVVSLLNAIAREAARAQRQADAASRRAHRAQIAQVRANARQAAANAREAKQRYLEARLEETDDMNADLASEVSELNALLAHTLSINDTIQFDDLRLEDDFPAFTIPTALAQAPTAPVRNTIRPPGFVARMVPGASKRHQQALLIEEQRFSEAISAYENAAIKHTSAINNERKKHKTSHDLFLAKVRQRNQEVDELENAYRNAEADAIVTYNTMVLEKSRYPENFPQEFRLAYVPESKELVVEYELPPVAIVPEADSYKYVKSSDSINGKPRKKADIKDLYQDVVASVALRTIHEIFEADQMDCVQVAVFNGFVHGVNPATGKDMTSHLISVRATKETFLGIDLARIDKKACLRNLGANVSPRPDELQAVKPIVDFNRIDKRFVEQSDVLADLEARPNLMDLSPFEFENLVSNLFDRMGLETKQTRSSRDGGVDAVAFDARPVLGGKVVIQCKRYRNTVDVSAVRDLYGTMLNEGANKGILVATSGYGQDAFEFSKDKPIELIDGGGLLYLLKEVGVNARIVFPTDG